MLLGTDMKVWIGVVPTPQADGAVMRREMFFLAHFEPLSITWAMLHGTAYLSMLVNMTIPFMTTVFWLMWDNTPHHKAQIISKWFPDHGNEFTRCCWICAIRSYLIWSSKGGQLLMKHHQWSVVSNTRLGVSTPVSTPIWPAKWLWKIWGRAYFKHLCW